MDIVSQLSFDSQHEMSMTMMIVNELSMTSHDGRLKWLTQVLLSSMEDSLYMLEAPVLAP